MKKLKQWFVWVPVMLVVIVANVFSMEISGEISGEIGGELGYFNQNIIYGQNRGSGFKYTVKASSPPFVFPATFNMRGDTSMGYFGSVYPRGFLKFKVNDFFTAGINLGYLKDSFEEIDYDSGGDEDYDYRWGDYNGDSAWDDDVAWVICYSTYTANRSISIIPIMGELNIKILKKESFSLGTSFSFGFSSVKIKDEIDIKNSTTQKVDYDADGTIDVTTPTIKTSKSYTIEDSKMFPTAEISLLCESNISKNVSATIGAGIQLLQADFGYKKQNYDDLSPKDWDFGQIALSGLHLFGGVSVNF